MTQAVGVWSPGKKLKYAGKAPHACLCVCMYVCAPARCRIKGKYNIEKRQNNNIKKHHTKNEIVVTRSGVTAAA